MSHTDPNNDQMPLSWLKVSRMRGTENSGVNLPLINYESNEGDLPLLSDKNPDVHFEGNGGQKVKNMGHKYELSLLA